MSELVGIWMIPGLNEIERMSEPGLLLTNLLKYLNNGKINNI